MIKCSCMVGGHPGFLQRPWSTFLNLLPTTAQTVHPIESDPLPLAHLPLLTPPLSFPIYNLYSASAFTSYWEISWWNWVSCVKRHFSLKEYEDAGAPRLCSWAFSPEGPSLSLFSYHAKIWKSVYEVIPSSPGKGSPGHIYNTMPYDVLESVYQITELYLWEGGDLSTVWF